MRAIRILETETPLHNPKSKERTLKETKTEETGRKISARGNKCKLTVHLHLAKWRATKKSPSKVTQHSQTNKERGKVLNETD